MSAFPPGAGIKPPSIGSNILRSAWMLWGLLSFGVLFFLGFLIIALRIRRVGWTVATLVMAAINITTLVFVMRSADDDTLVPVAGTFMLIGFFLGFALALSMNQSWLLFRWEQLNGVTLESLTQRASDDWAARAAAGPWPTASAPSGVPRHSARGQRDTPWQGSASDAGRAWRDAAAGAPAGGPAGLPAPPSAWGGSTPAPAPRGLGAPLINVNTASAQELASLPGVGPDLASEIVGERTVRGPFASVTDLVARGVVPPHVFLGFSTQLTVGAGAGAPATGPAPQRGAQRTARPGPQSPPDPGRRLEF